MRNRTQESWRKRLLEIRWPSSPPKNSFDLTCPVLVVWIYNLNFRSEVFHPWKRKELLSLLKLVHKLEWIEGNVIYSIFVSGKGRYRREMYPISAGAGTMDIYYDEIEEKEKG